MEEGDGVYYDGYQVVIVRRWNSVIIGLEGEGRSRRWVEERVCRPEATTAISGKQPDGEKTPPIEPQFPPKTQTVA